MSALAALRMQKQTGEEPLKVVCAWCRKTISGRGSLLSHGICDKCYGQIFQLRFDFLPLQAPPPRVKKRRPNPGQKSADDSQLGFEL